MGWIRGKITEGGRVFEGVFFFVVIFSRICSLFVPSIWSLFATQVAGRRKHAEGRQEARRRG
jgi:hypothetical protein